MYTPTVESCHCCSGKESPGQQFARRMAETTSGPVVDRTSQLYRIPVAMISGDQAKECISWPRYCHGEFSFQNTTGSSMLELSLDERRALVILVLRTSVQQEKYGAAHHHNWKKVGLSRAYYKKELVCEQSMPTDRSKAAFRFLMANNMYYKVFRGYQKICIDTGSSHNLSSYDLFVVLKGIECAMFPVLYPTTDFTDTGIMEHYLHQTGDTTNRVCSIGLSWTRKVLSSVRVFGEQRDLPFFLYEKHLAMKYFSAQVRAKELAVTGDVLTRDSQTSSGYWDIVQDSLADLVRIMLVRCYDSENYPQLYKHCRNLRGEVWLCAFPNLFLTIAPAEWKFPRPYFMEPYCNCVFAGAYIMALHMYYLVRCMWLFLANRFGHKYFIVFEWCMKTEYQGRGNPHWHIAVWVVCFYLLVGSRDVLEQRWYLHS